MQPEEISAWSNRLLKRSPRSVTQLAGGKNNRIFAVEFPEGSSVIAKCYLMNPSDPRDRCGTEFTAHTFLWQQGVRHIAEPLARSDSGEIAFFSRIHGSRAPVIDEAAIDQAVTFAGRLAELSRRPEAGESGLPAASEAAFSGPELLAILDRRLQALRETVTEGGGGAAFGAFVREGLSAAVGACRAALEASKLRLFLRTELPADQRILSPSDFGFHNALRDESGVWSFLDFEYFGWDDPVKLVCDFTLHPAMQLSPELQKRFRNRLAPYLSHFDEIDERIAILLPCYRAKWSMIMLNEFQRQHKRRREFAMGHGGVDETTLALQLERSKRMLQGD